MSNYSKVVGYKASIQNSVAFLCISDKQVEFGIKNITPFILPS